VSDDDDPRTPIDQALDVFVYLPLGFMLDFPRSIPRYIERGRRQFEAVKRISRESLPPGTTPTEHLDRLQAQTRNTLRALGVVSDNGAASGHASRSGETARPYTVAAVPSPTSAPGAVADAATSESSAPPATAIGGDDEPAIDATTLAIPDYDSLSASQVVPRLDSLSLEELELVRQYENAKRGRKTILSKIAQLQAG
jgi:hypothetical protein